jgi:two-component system response regulator GlrR
MQKHILSVDDEPEISGMIQKALAMEGYRVSAAASAEDAWRIVQSDPPQLIISDLQLEDTDGLSMVEEIHKTIPDLPVLLLTGVIFDHDVIQGLVGKKVSSYLPKTSSLDTIRKEVRRLVGPPSA